jgi:hypothetical protein
VEKQLGAGKDLAKGMGGMDRKDGVGQGSLGVWFARKLSSESFVSRGEQSRNLVYRAPADGRDVQTRWPSTVWTSLAIC